MEIENREPIIIMLAGKARAGKDTTANFIKEYADSNDLKIVNLQFSYYIKMYAKLLTNWDGSEDTKPRTLLQQLGTDIIRDRIDNYFFIDRIINDIKVLSYFADIITISDTRLPEELDKIYNTYNKVVKINIVRDNYNNNLNEMETQHRTETSLDNYSDYNYVIENNGTLDELKNKINDILKEILERGNLWKMFML